MLDLRGTPKDRRERLQRLIDDIRDKTFHYKPRPSKDLNWHRYDEAQANERADVLNLIRLLVDDDAEPPRPRQRGRPPTYAAKDKTKTMLLQTYLQASNRISTGDCRIFREKLGVKSPIPYKTIERSYSDPTVQGLIFNVFNKTVNIAAQHTTGYTLDGSGIPTTIKVNWERDKSENKKMADVFDGAITMLALPLGVITSFLPRRIGFESEVDQLQHLVDGTTRRTGGLSGIVSADAGFQSRANCEHITSAGGTPRIFPKRNVTRRTKGAPSWTRMLNDLEKDPQGWLEEYHLRSLAETFWSVYGGLFSRPLRRRLAPRRMCEHVARFTVFNLVRLSRGCRLNELPAADPVLRAMLN